MAHSHDEEAQNCMGHLGLAVIDDGPRQVRRLHLPLNLSFPRPKSLLDLEDNE